MARDDPPRLTHHTELERVRIHDFAAEERLRSTVLRTVRYRHRCSCGWLGRSWSHWRDAELEARWHRG